MKARSPFIITACCGDEVSKVTVATTDTIDRIDQARFDRVLDKFSMDARVDLTQGKQAFAAGATVAGLVRSKWSMKVWKALLTTTQARYRQSLLARLARSLGGRAMPVVPAAAVRRHR